MRQKRFSWIIILLILALLAVLSYVAYLRGYLNLNFSQKTVFTSPSYLTETSQSIPAQIEGWKTFRDDEIGFEFKYPNNWQIILSSKTSLIISNKYSDPSLSVTTPLPNQVILNFGLNHASLENYSSTERRYEPTEGVEVIEQGRYLHDCGCFGIVTLYRADDNNASEYEKTINQIVSTLKFTQQ